jgi:4-hydroxybenzoate polyprenyltransferase
VDPIIESLFALVRAKPSLLLRLPAWISRGRSGVLKGMLEDAPPEIRTQCFQPEVLAYLRAQKSEGRLLGLAGGANDDAARAMARELGLFDAVWAVEDFGDLSSQRRREVLRQCFGNEHFDYLMAHGDQRLRREAVGVLIVEPSGGGRPEVADRPAVKAVFKLPAGGPMDYFRAMRPRHWIKNLLLFVAIGAAHRWPDAKEFRDLLLAFIAFSLCASGGYLLNDLFDLASDASHPQTRHRQLASRLIRSSRVLLLFVLVMGLAVAASWNLPRIFLGVLGAYFLMMTLYSLRLKEVAVLDILILAAGYALRVGAGSVVVGIWPSTWLIALCIFLFQSLASIKRYAELIAMRGTSGPSARVRGYLASDAGIVAAEGIASGYVAVLVLALYTNTSVAQQLYGRHELFWVICLLLLYWINYLWLMARRARIEHDPLVFAMRDRTSLILVSAMGVATLCAL